MKGMIDKKTAKKILLDALYPLLAIAIMLAVWAVIAKIKNDEFVLPMPKVVLEKFFTLGIGDGATEFWKGTALTLLRTILSFAVSFLFAVLLSAASGVFRPLNRVLSPIVSVLRAAPTVAVILVLYSLVQNASFMSAVVGFLIAFPIMYSAFYGAIVGVDGDLLAMAKCYGVRRVDKIRFIYLPCVADCLFDTGRATLSLTLKVVIAAEIIVCIPSSLGAQIQEAYASFAISLLLARTLVAILFSFVLEWCVAGLKKLRRIL